VVRAFGNHCIEDLTPRLLGTTPLDSARIVIGRCCDGRAWPGRKERKLEHGRVRSMVMKDEFHLPLSVQQYLDYRKAELVPRLGKVALLPGWSSLRTGPHNRQCTNPFFARIRLGFIRGQQSREILCIQGPCASYSDIVLSGPVPRQGPSSPRILRPALPHCTPRSRLMPHLVCQFANSPRSLNPGCLRRRCNPRQAFSGPIPSRLAAPERFSL